MDQLVLLPEEAAIRSFFDTLNCRRLFRLLPLVALAVFIAGLVRDLDGVPGPVVEKVIVLANLILILVLYRLRDRPFLTRHFRLCCVTYLIAQALLGAGIGFDPAQSYHPAFFILPLILLVFRLTPGELGMVLGAGWALAAGRDLVAAALTQAELRAVPLYILTVISALAFVVVSVLTRRRQRQFLLTWRREHHRYRERRRMREELDDARKIQLSMLPRADPVLPWLEMAGLSVPASEVGGDYYDYFRLSPSQQAIVVGDVAGHGVASGLLLSGVRSCLHLLQETPMAPAEILGKLDRMVRQTTASRMFITLLYALFDRAAGRVTVAAAGHPPVLHRCAATGQVEELGAPALPLGTGLGSSLREVTTTFAAEDVFLLYSDGIAEMINGHGELYGDQRLRQRLATLSPERGAKEIRDAILGHVWSFKGDGQQLDDITVVVVRARGAKKSTANKIAQ